jgi:hypothetical protein
MVTHVLLEMTLLVTISWMKEPIGKAHWPGIPRSTRISAVPPYTFSLIAFSVPMSRRPPMRLTVLRQQLKERCTAASEQNLDMLDAKLEPVKWFLWHGNVFRALEVIEGVQWRLESLDEEVPASCKLAKKVAEFHGSIKANETFIPNYGDRHHDGEVISTAFTEARFTA